MTWQGSAKPDGYVIGLCGTHGTGKSTVIKGLKEAGIPVDESQLSRQAQKELGWDSLDRVKDKPENIWLLQEAILGAMYDRDCKINESKVVTVVDRTPADVTAYTLLWLFKLDYIGPELRDQFSKFNQRCRVMSSKYARHVYFPIREEIEFVAEAQRAAKDDREMHDRHIKNFITGHLHTHEVVALTPEDRIAELRAVYEYETWYTKELDNA